MSFGVMLQSQLTLAITWPPTATNFNKDHQGAQVNGIVSRSSACITDHLVQGR
jgi:hypothetical protein